MKLANKGLFNFEEVSIYIKKFENKLGNSHIKYERLKEDIEKLESEIDFLIEKDILADGNEYVRDLNNANVRKANLENQLNDEIKKALKIKEIMIEGLSKIIPQIYNQHNEDMFIYNNVVERKVFEELKDLREKQAILLLTLQSTRNKLCTELHELDDYCELFGFTQYKRNLTYATFHNNMFYPNRNYPELGAPLLNINMLTAIEDILMRSRAEANAMYNRDKEGDECEQLPQAYRLSDIDINEYLKQIQVE